MPFLFAKTAFGFHKSSAWPLTAHLHPIRDGSIGFFALYLSIPCKKSVYFFIFGYALV